MYDYPSLIDAAEQKAARGSGLSDTLYESRVQSSYASILRNAPDEQRAATEAALIARGFVPDFVRPEAAADECLTTGIKIDWCPCGGHP